MAAEATSPSRGSLVIRIKPSSEVLLHIDSPGPTIAVYYRYVEPRWVERLLRHSFSAFMKTAARGVGLPRRFLSCVIAHRQNGGENHFVLFDRACRPHLVIALDGVTGGSPRVVGADQTQRGGM